MGGYQNIDATPASKPELCLQVNEFEDKLPLILRVETYFNLIQHKIHVAIAYPPRILYTQKVEDVIDEGAACI